MILDMIQEWFKELLIDGIISNLTGMFDTLNTKVGEIAGEVGMTPAAWNSSIFNMIRNLSETVIVPIAGIILTFVMCYELIQLIIEKNNLHDFDTWIFFKWIFKTFCAVLIVTNTWNIVMAVFDVAQNVVSQSAGVIISDAGIDISGVVGDLETQLADWSVGALLGLWFQSVFVGLCTQILSICIFLVIYGRMIEVYLVTSIGPIPFATMVNREWGSTGQNYLRSLLALGFQAFLIMICVGIYAVLVGVPLFFLAKASLGTTTAALCMILVMLPFFLFAMYEKNGQPLEVFLGHLIQNKFIRPKVRIYQTNNLYSALVRQSQLEQEVKRIARKGRKTGKA